MVQRRVGRRAWLAGLSLACCTRKDEAIASEPRASSATQSASQPPPAVSSSRITLRTQSWTLGQDGRAYVILPEAKDTEPLPLLFALHGRGEARKGPDRGVLGWPQDYALLRAIERVYAPPLTPADFEHMVDRERMRAHNAALTRQPFRGLAIVCPYSPDVELRKPEQIAEYTRFFMREVLPRAQKELPVRHEPRHVGIDGVSLGGALALRIGLQHAESFGAVGSLQAAIGEDQVGEYVELVTSARRRNPSLNVRLLTSDKDFFRRAIAKTSASLRAASVEHDFANVPGVHDYPFNRGPGAIEMLLWHDRVLRG